MYEGSSDASRGNRGGRGGHWHKAGCHTGNQCFDPAASDSDQGDDSLVSMPSEFEAESSRLQICRQKKDEKKGEKKGSDDAAKHQKLHDNEDESAEDESSVDTQDKAPRMIVCGTVTLMEKRKAEEIPEKRKAEEIPEKRKPEATKRAESARSHAEVPEKKRARERREVLEKKRALERTQSPIGHHTSSESSSMFWRRSARSHARRREKKRALERREKKKLLEQLRRDQARSPTSMLATAATAPQTAAPQTAATAPQTAAPQTAHLHRRRLHVIHGTAAKAPGWAPGWAPAADPSSPTEMPVVDEPRSPTWS